MTFVDFHPEKHLFLLETDEYNVLASALLMSASDKFLEFIVHYSKRHNLLIEAEQEIKRRKDLEND